LIANRWPARRYFCKWAKSGELGSLALIGLVRKALQQLQIMPTVNSGGDMKRLLCPVLLLAAFPLPTLRVQTMDMPDVPALAAVPDAARQAAASIDPEKALPSIL
jgi:hypothetical protein